ncbi:hypothetical protein BKA62DRAFT_676853 [Auriculariales sp. MPI-PUGE-AT-0066]|nr:hypothetical protein BKA62DRAFT_676853 [Auriculariales sp. MPI-PUGE-AT-0066]
MSTSDSEIPHTPPNRRTAPESFISVSQPFPNTGDTIRDTTSDNSDTISFRSDSSSLRPTALEPSALPPTSPLELSTSDAENEEPGVILTNTGRTARAILAWLHIIGGRPALRSIHFVFVNLVSSLFFKLKCINLIASSGECSDLPLYFREYLHVNSAGLEWFVNWGNRVRSLWLSFRPATLPTEVYTIIFRAMRMLHHVEPLVYEEAHSQAGTVIPRTVLGDICDGATPVGLQIHRGTKRRARNQGGRDSEFAF